MKIALIEKELEFTSSLFIQIQISYHATYQVYIYFYNSCLHSAYFWGRGNLKYPASVIKQYER